MKKPLSDPEGLFCMSRAWAGLLLLAIAVVAGLAARAHVAESGAQLVEVAGIRGGRQLDDIVLERLLLLRI